MDRRDPPSLPLGIARADGRTAQARPERLAWRRTLPVLPGTYRLWDPDRAVNGLVTVFCARGGRLAVRNPCGCCAALFLDMWRQPAFGRAQWLGPIEVPSVLPPDLDLPTIDQIDGPAHAADRRVRKGRCLLGPHG